MAVIAARTCQIVALPGRVPCVTASIDGRTKHKCCHVAAPGITSKALMLDPTAPLAWVVNCSAPTAPHDWVVKCSAQLRPMTGW